MNSWSAQDWVLIIGAIAGLTTSTIAAWKATRSTQIAQQNTAQLTAVEEKTDEVKSLTNGNMTEVREELRIQKAKNEYLHAVINGLVDHLPPGKLAEVKQTLGTIGKRRKDDVHPGEDW